MQIQNHIKRVNFSRIKGFSLLELLVVIAVVGLLTAIGVPAYKMYQNRAALSEFHAIIKAAKSKWQTLNETNPDSLAAGVTDNLADGPIYRIEYGTNGFSVYPAAYPAAMNSGGNAPLRTSALPFFYANHSRADISADYDTQPGVLNWVCNFDIFGDNQESYAYGENNAMTNEEVTELMFSTC